MALHRLRVRTWLVLAATAGVALVVGRLLVGVVLDGSAAAERSGPAALDAWAGTVAAAGALLVLGWWSVSFTVAVVVQARQTTRAGRAVRHPPSAAPSVSPSVSPSAAPSAVLPTVRSAARSISRSPAPSMTQRLAAAALGVALTAGPAAAHAAVDRPAGGAPSPTSPTSPTSTTSPTRAGDTSEAGDRHGSPRRSAWSADRPAGGDVVVVRPGDTLWTLAATRLGDGDPAHERDVRAVAAAWPRWWHANRAVVGPDPDLIRPGQVLHPPTDLQEER
jgi:resuscitation-promoting factor RpfA